MDTDFSSNDFVGGSGDQAISYPATSGHRYVVAGVIWSFESDPDGGALSIRVDGDLVFQMLVGKSGSFVFQNRRRTPANVDLVISLTMASGNLGRALFADVTKETV